MGEVRVGCFERTASKHVYYLGWNRSPAQAGCMIQVLGPGALGRPIGIGWRGRREGGSGWGIHVNPWLIHVNVWQNYYNIVISLQLIKINEKKKGEVTGISVTVGWWTWDGRATAGMLGHLYLGPQTSSIDHPTKASYSSFWLNGNNKPL